MTPARWKTSASRFWPPPAEVKEALRAVRRLPAGGPDLPAALQAAVLAAPREVAAIEAAVS